MVQCSFLPKKEGMLQLEGVTTKLGEFQSQEGGLLPQPVEELNLKQKLVEPQPVQKENPATNRENLKRTYP